MDIWFWIVIVVAAVLLALIIAGTRGTRKRVDPTQLSIDPALAAQVRECYAKGDKLQAVKTLRAATGLGLADAIRIVDKLGAGTQRGPSAGRPGADGVGPVVTQIGPDNEHELRSLVASGHQIEAIKLVRQLTGMDLQDAKDFVDRIEPV